MPPVTPWDPATGVTGGLAAQAWQVAMLGLWNAGLWLLGLVLHLEDALLTPDLRADGPAGEAYALTLWMAAALGVVMLLAQLLVALLRRDAHSLGAALLGCAKFVVVWAGWVGWASAVVAVCGGLTRAVLQSLLHVSSFSGWHPSLRISPEQAVDVTVATVLGLLGMVLWLAALGHVLVMLGRAVTLLVLAATTPIAAAGLVGELGRGWFWRSVRWFHAAALTPLLMALLLGVGVQTTDGVTAGLADGAARAVGAALPGVLLVLTSCFAPLAMFRLLSFVDPATSAGATFRQTLMSAMQAAQLLGAPGRWPSALDHQTPDATPTTGSGSGSHPGGTGGDTSADRRGDAERSLQSAPTPTADDTPPGRTAAADLGPAPSPIGTGTGADGAGNAATAPASAEVDRALSTTAAHLPPTSGGSADGAGSAVVGEAGVVPVVAV